MREAERARACPAPSAREAASASACGAHGAHEAEPPAAPGAAAARGGAAAPGGLARAREWARAGLEVWSRERAGTGVPVPSADGQLIRATLAWLGTRPFVPEPAGWRAFWSAAAAVQLAHEASLLHDDVVDGAVRRRNAATVAAVDGIGAALVQGDHLLTAGYRAAAATGSMAFAAAYAEAVERTVAGELRQGRAAGKVLSREEYREIVLGKSGELLGCALSAAARLAGDWQADEVHRLGRRVGLVYQMLDDLLDYCPGADTGKPALQDYAQGRWTWVLDHLPAVRFGLEPELVLDRLHAAGAGCSPIRRALAELAREAEVVAAEARVLLGPCPELEELLGSWTSRALEAVQREEQCRRGSTLRALATEVPAVSASARHLARHSKSFRFASRLFPAAERRRVAAVYAFCRVTDDLVDAGGDPAVLGARLDAWLEAARTAYAGRPSGLALVDAVMGDMARSRVPFFYVEELVAGMRMDLEGRRYATLRALDVYAYRVAGVVGQWLTELAGVHDPALLERAADLGKAMQLTNILRDVGEDWGRGRLYLPADLLRRHGVSGDDIAAAVRGGPLPRGWAALVEELMAQAELRYAAAFQAMPSLPAGFRAPVAVAAALYRGIHGAIRRNGYDTLRRRAHTGPLEKLRLALRGLAELRRVRGPLQLRRRRPLRGRLAPEASC